uniref:BTB domain-containing protein n=1 Tax=Trichogramma kaykai TaxID=54128 RepID=A0ABD2XMT0_9HYME
MNSAESYLIVAPNGVLVSSYFLNVEDSDARIVAKDGREVPAHRCILSPVSPIFRMIFEMKAEQPRPVNVSTDMSYDAVIETMRFIYMACVNFNCKPGIAEELVEVADSLQMPRFKRYCEQEALNRSFSSMGL